MKLTKYTIHYFWAGPCTYENAQKVDGWRRVLWVWDRSDIKFKPKSDLEIKNAKNICSAIDTNIIQKFIDKKLYAAAADYFRYLVLMKCNGLWMDYADTEVVANGERLKKYVNQFDEFPGRHYMLVSNDYPYGLDKIIPLNSVIYNNNSMTMVNFHYWLKGNLSNNSIFNIITSNAWGLMDLLAFFMQKKNSDAILLERVIFIGDKESKLVPITKVVPRKNKEAYWSDLVDSKKDIPYIPLSGLFLNQPFQKFLRKVLGRRLSIKLYFKFIELRHKMFKIKLRRNGIIY